ncbi:MAG: PHP domain-containing protein [Spirochaetia bacterium]
MKNPSSYAPVHCRSSYSLLRGVAPPEEICDRAAEMGASAVGIADINGFYGLLRFSSAAAERGLRALYGTAIHRNGRHLCTLFCVNMRGFAGANRIIGGLLASEDYDPVEELISEGWEGLWVVTRDIDVLRRLGREGKSLTGLFAGIVYGYPCDEARRAAGELGVPLFAFNDAVYCDEQRRRGFRVVRAIGENRLVSSIPPFGGLTKAERLVGPEEMERFFSAVPEAVENARRFVREAEGFTVPRRCVFPSFRGLDEERAYALLRRLCLRGAARRFGVNLSLGGTGAFAHRKYAPPAGKGNKIMRRLDYELSIIRRKGFASYFLVVHDVVRRFPRTCGRGSSAASIVSYSLGITHVDPLRHKLFFERFLNDERSDPPDIDVDFPWDEREEALDYLFRSYPGRAAMVADHVTFGPRSALRETGRVLGYDKEMQDRFELLRRRGRENELPPQLRETVEILYGMPRHIGTHPGGVVITPGPITDYTHVQKSPMGRQVIAWEKDGAEDAGLVKIDLLGNRSLGVLRDSLREINRTYGTRIEWESFSPLENGETRKLIEKGETLGVFYIESPATRQLLQKMGTGDYEHLVAASSIIRPAANSYIHEYVRRLRGGSFSPLPGPVGEVLEETYGIMVYQEDVSRVAAAAAGFSPGEADRLRKVLSKKNRAAKLPSFHRAFIKGGRAEGFSRELLEELWKGILSFDGYSFCKPHSASYALLSYRLAWVKRHFPLIFFTAVLNNRGGFYTPQVYVNEVRRMGYSILGPDINESELSHTPDYRRAGLRLGFVQIRDLRLETAKKIVEHRRRKGEFTDILDFLDRTSPDTASLRSLIRSGTLDSISGGYTRPQLFWLSYHRERGRGLFGMPPLPSEIGDYSPPEKLRDEVRFLGLFIKSHPLEVFYPRITLFIGGTPPLIDSRRIGACLGSYVRIAGYLVTEKEVRTKDRKEMSFVSFEDSYGVFESVLFPEAYARLSGVLENGAVFVLEGRVESEWGALQITVDKLFSLNRRDFSERGGPDGNLKGNTPGGPVVFPRWESPIQPSRVPSWSSAGSGTFG